jgi:hypothetical protein
MIVNTHSDSSETRPVILLLPHSNHPSQIHSIEIYLKSVSKSTQIHLKSLSHRREEGCYGGANSRWRRNAQVQGRNPSLKNLDREDDRAESSGEEAADSGAQALGRQTSGYECGCAGQECSPNMIYQHRG